jgi:tetratricopeptide (TPR) repeat protein
LAIRASVEQILHRLSLARIETRSQAVASHTASAPPPTLVLLQRFRDNKAVRSILATLSYLDATEVPMSIFRKTLRHNELSEALEILKHASAVQSNTTSQTLDIHPLARELVRLELESSEDRNKLLVGALRSTRLEFQIDFSRPRTLADARTLSIHAVTVLNSAMNTIPDPSVFKEAVGLALRYCMYLLTDSHYDSVIQFIPQIQRWCRNLLHHKVNREVATALKARLAIAQASTGNIHDALRIFSVLGDSRIRHFGTDNIVTLHNFNNLALIQYELGDYREAVEIHSKVLKSKSSQLGKLDPDALVSANNLGVAFQSQGHHDAAQRLFDRSLYGWSQIYDPDDLLVLSAQSNRGTSLFLQGRLDDAERDHRLVYRERRRILGRIHHETLKSKANLAMTINDKGNHERAEQLYREVFEGFDDQLGPTHPDTLRTYTNLATCLHDQEKYEEAEALILSAIPLMEFKYGSRHAETLDAMEFRAILLHCLELYIPALEVATFVYNVRYEALGYDHADTQRSLGHVRDLAENCEEERTVENFPAFVQYIAV